MSKRWSVSSPTVSAVVVAVLTALMFVIVAILTIPTTSTKGSQSSSASSSTPFRFTPTEIVVIAVIVGMIVFSVSIAAALYWRRKTLNSQAAHEAERRQRDEVEKILERLRDRMTLPGLLELNRLMLSEYHSIATNQAQKSFRSAQRAMLGGFTWLIVCFTAVILVSSFNGKILAAALAPVGGALAGFLSRTYLFVYERSLVQLNQYYNQPLLNSYYLAAERLTTEMSSDGRDKLLGKVIDQLLVAAGRLSEGAAQNSAVTRKRSVKAPGIKRGLSGENGQATTLTVGTPE